MNVQKLVDATTGVSRETALDYVAGYRAYAASALDLARGCRPVEDAEIYAAQMTTAQMWADAADAVEHRIMNS